jgi:hypothetical protein
MRRQGRRPYRGFGGLFEFTSGLVRNGFEPRGALLLGWSIDRDIVSFESGGVVWVPGLHVANLATEIAVALARQRGAARTFRGPRFVRRSSVAGTRGGGAPALDRVGGTSLEQGAWSEGREIGEPLALFAFSHKNNWRGIRKAPVF